MDHTVVIPPDAQLDPLLRAYDRAVAAKHRQFLVGILCMAAAFALACIGAEINPALFWEKLGNFTSYFDRLAHLDTGAAVWTAIFAVDSRLHRLSEYSEVCSRNDGTT